MSKPTIPFHYGLFYHAMIGYLGRAPDYKHAHGTYYSFRYEPQDAAEEARLEVSVPTLRDWLSNFEFIPLESQCTYGRLAYPQDSEEGKDYLYIVIQTAKKKCENNCQDCSCKEEKKKGRGGQITC
jgi:hypothetical protein